jgi:hypothetical protein
MRAADWGVARSASKAMPCVSPTPFQPRLGFRSPGVKHFTLEHAVFSVPCYRVVIVLTRFAPKNYTFDKEFASCWPM